jgi:HEAT repeat protein
MQELGESEESVPVLLEIFRGRPGRTETMIERDYFSRAHSVISRQLRQEEIFGKPLVLALTDLTRDSDPDVRRAAFRVLRGSSLEAPEILATILAGLSDEHAEVRKEAITVLAETSDEVKQAMLPQLRALAQNPQCDPTVYRSIIRWVDPEEADRIELQELAEQLVGGDSRTRRQALRKLGEFEGYAAERVPALTAALDDPDLWNRCSAAYALGKIGSAAKDAIPRLANALQSDDRMRSAAATALGSMGPDAKTATPDLLKMLKDSNLYDRVVAAEALWRIDGQADVVTPVLHEVLSSRDHQHSYTRVKAAEVLWDIERQIDEVFLILRRATSSKEAGKVLEKIESDCVSADEKRALAICYLRHAPFEKQKISLHSYEKAAELLTAISEADRIAADWGLLGQALYRTDRWEDALRALERANECRGETKPTLTSGPRWWYLVLTLARLGENEQAVAHYEQLVGELMKAPPQELPKHRKLRAEAARLLGINIE